MRAAVESAEMAADETSRAGSQEPGARQAAIDYGIDVIQLEYLLTLTPAERLERHEQFLSLVEAVREGGRRHYGCDPRNPGATGEP